MDRISDFDQLFWLVNVYLGRLIDRERERRLGNSPNDCYTIRKDNEIR